MAEVIVGQLVKYQDRVWRVGLVNASRARLDPVTGTLHKLLSAEFVSYGNSVNVSPGSPLEVVEDRALTPEQHRRAEALAHRTDDTFIVQQPEENRMAETAVAEQPGPVAAKPAKKATAAVAQPTVSANKTANKARLEAIKAKAAEKAVVKAAAPKKEKTVRPCMCGCGEQVTSYFAQGHDARFKGWMIKVERGTMAVKDLPPVVQKSNTFVKRGEGYVTTKNYKGEAHKGYDKAVG